MTKIRNPLAIARQIFALLRFPCFSKRKLMQKLSTAVVATIAPSQFKSQGRRPSRDTIGMTMNGAITAGNGSSKSSQHPAEAGRGCGGCGSGSGMAGRTSMFAALHRQRSRGDSHFRRPRVIGA